MPVLDPCIRARWPIRIWHPICTLREPGYSKPNWNGGRRAAMKASALVPTLAVLLSATAMPVVAPPAAGQASAAQSTTGNQPAFDVASVKPNKSGNRSSSNFPLGPGDVFTPNGGFFSATNLPLVTYLAVDNDSPGRLAAQALGADCSNSYLQAACVISGCSGPTRIHAAKWPGSISRNGGLACEQSATA